MRYPWENKELYVWMDLGLPEILENVLRDYGIRRVSGKPAQIYLHHYYSVCPVCGRMVHTQSTDPWHPDPESIVESENRDIESLVSEFKYKVKILITRPGLWDAETAVCDACRSAWQRDPEVMSVVRNMIQMAIYKSKVEEEELEKTE